MGLALARSLAELHKGTLCLQQGKDRLNIFILTLPLHQVHEFSSLTFGHRINYN